MDTDLDTRKPAAAIRDSLDRVGRWIDRLRPLIEDVSDAVPMDVRLNIQDFAAAAFGDLAGAFEKAKDELAFAGRESGVGREAARRRAHEFVSDWLDEHLLIRGLIAVRHADVHLELRHSGRILRIALGSANPDALRRDMWILPGLPAPINARLRPSSKLADAELDEFNRMLQEITVVSALEAAVETTSTSFLPQLEAQMDEVGHDG